MREYTPGREALCRHATPTGDRDRPRGSDDRFAATAPATSVFADKHALAPPAAPTEIAARDPQERDLATRINGSHAGYLPPAVSVNGPPGTGQPLTPRRICRAFAARHAAVAVESVTLTECRTLFSAAHDSLCALTGAKKGAYAGLDGVFTGIWAALEASPAWTVLLLDEFDHVRHDTNAFFYWLVCGGGETRPRDRSVGLAAAYQALTDCGYRISTLSASLSPATSKSASATTKRSPSASAVPATNASRAARGSPCW